LDQTCFAASAQKRTGQQASVPPVAANGSATRGIREKKQTLSDSKKEVLQVADIMKIPSIQPTPS